MAVRVDFYSVPEAASFEPTGQDEAGWIGFIAASDDDEGEMVALLEACELHGLLAGAVKHGSGVETAAAASCTAVAPPSPLARTWLDVIGWAVESVAVQQRRLGWSTRYDRGGSRDDGADEWKTSWSDAPTEGTDIDVPWPPG